MCHIALFIIIGYVQYPRARQRLISFMARALIVQNPLLLPKRNMYNMATRLCEHLFYLCLLCIGQVLGENDIEFDVQFTSL